MSDPHATARAALPPEALARGFQEAPLGMSLVGLDGTILHVNDEFRRVLAVTPEAVIGIRYAELFAEDPEPHRSAAARMMSGAMRRYEREARYRTGDGRMIWLLAAASLVRDADDRPLYFVNQVYDVSERRRREAALRALADHDPITGLANRRRFDREARRQLRYLSRYGTSLALLLVDLDDFKAVNDTHGHLAGDRVLREVAGVLRDRLRSTDVIARVGGDEFAALLPEVDVETATRVAGDIVAGVATDLAARDAPRVGVSVGVASTDDLAAPSLDALLAAADRGLYAAKAAGRGCARADPGTP